MLPLLLLLLSLQSLSQPAGAVVDLFLDVLNGVTDALNDYFYDYTEEPSDVDESIDSTFDWLFDFFDETDVCDPNPCFNNGVCESGFDGRFSCICPRPFKGKKCQDIENVCKNVNCGQGECVRIPEEPFYECKCRAPYQPPTCKRPSPCNPSPCLNGGTCVKRRKKRKRSSFRCVCPENYSGTFCEIGLDDCYEGDGESYRGFVSKTVNELDCLPWNSYLLPYSEFDGDDGVGPHNYCRNPDGESQPWCFVRYKGKLKWDDCDARRCPEPVSTTESTTEVPVMVTTAPSKQDFSVCGKSQPTRALGKIFGGRKALPGAHPWQASLQVRRKRSSGPFRHVCGGTLIDSCWVLTAAHCIERMNEMQVGLGGVNLERQEAADQTVKVEDFIIHENYTETPDALYNDIALLKLKAVDGQCARETRFVKAACLPTGLFADGTECTISGYGITEDDEEGSSQLLDAKVLLISQKRCTAPQIYGDVLDDGMFCAGHMQGGVDSCQGDSGGPLVCKQNDIHYVYGVVSWGDACGKKNKPGIYARVPHYLNWINEQMRSS